MSLKKVLADWDGKSANDIKAIFTAYHSMKGFQANLIVLINQSNDLALQKAASWLLKYQLESGTSISTANVKKVYGALPSLTGWESQLHILQCIPYMPIAAAEKKAVELFLRQCLSHDNKFVRAWAYNGFFELACQYDAYREETEHFFSLALKDEAASVKARIRQIAKNGFPSQ